MHILTVLSRVGDGLMLAEAMDTDDKIPDVDSLRSQAKKILKTVTHKSEKELSIETDPPNYYFCYIIRNDVCYLTLCEHSYPKKSAFKFLEELQKEFDIQYGADVAKAVRPYSFINFDTFIQKTKKVYASSTRIGNLTRVTDDLTDVHRIMTKNISEILGRGERIESVAKKSDELLAGAILYEKAAKQLNLKMFWRKYGLGIVAAAIFILVLYWRFLW